MKTEPDVFSFDDLIAAPDQTECWDGVRNYQARNFMRDEFKLNDLVLFYHSRTAEPSIVGIAKVVKEGYPDDTALDPKEKYFDEKSARDGQSRWVMVDVKAFKRLKKPVSLKELREYSELKDMALLQRGQRLSIQKVTKKEFDFICDLGQPTKI